MSAYDQMTVSTYNNNNDASVAMQNQYPNNFESISHANYASSNSLSTKNPTNANFYFCAQEHKGLRTDDSCVLLLDLMTFKT